MHRDKQNITAELVKHLLLNVGGKGVIRKGCRAVSEVWQYFDLISIHITFNFLIIL